MVGRASCRMCELLLLEGGEDGDGAGHLCVTFCESRQVCRLLVVRDGRGAARAVGNLVGDRGYSGLR